MSNGAQTRKKRSQEKILKAAEYVFLKNGFLGTNMDVIADRAGVSKQTVYANFQSKEILFKALATSMSGMASAELREDQIELPTNDDVKSFFLEIAEQQLMVVMTPRLMQLRRMVIGEVERFPELGEALHENGPKNSIARLAHAIKFYHEKGLLYAPNAAAAARQFNWLLMGAPTNDAMLLGDKAIPNKAALKAQAQEAVRIFLCAFGPYAPEKATL